jgi:aminopeptidase N
MQKQKILSILMFLKNADLVNINADGILVADITDTKTPEQNAMQLRDLKNLKADILR